jgi:hypothetical protein
MTIEEKLLDLSDQLTEVSQEKENTELLLSVVLSLKTGEVKLEDLEQQYTTTLEELKDKTERLEENMNILSSVDVTAPQEKPKEPKLPPIPDQLAYSNDLNVYEKGMLEDGQTGVKMRPGVMSSVPEAKVIFI